jgi:hypothetical protein
MTRDEIPIDPAAPDAPDPVTGPGHPLGNDPRLSPGHVHAVDPGHGEPVTFQPGELLPAWVLAEFAAGASLAVEGPGVFRLVPSRPGRAAPAGRTAPRKQTAGGA